jgi:hypothetical protein
MTCNRFCNMPRRFSTATCRDDTVRSEHRHASVITLRVMHADTRGSLRGRLIAIAQTVCRGPGGCIPLNAR